MDAQGQEGEEDPALQLRNSTYWRGWVMRTAMVFRTSTTNARILLLA